MADQEQGSARDHAPGADAATPESAATCYHLTIPKMFARDRDERDLSIGEGRWTSRGFVSCLNAEELADLRSDALFYSDKTGFCESVPRGLFASARATLRAVEAAVQS